MIRRKKKNKTRIKYGRVIGWSKMGTFRYSILSGNGMTYCCIILQNDRLATRKPLHLYLIYTRRKLSQRPNYSVLPWVEFERCLCSSHFPMSSQSACYFCPRNIILITAPHLRHLQLWPVAELERDAYLEAPWHFARHISRSLP